jgi:hypothetical protein
MSREYTNFQNTVEHHEEEQLSQNQDPFELFLSSTRHLQNQDVEEFAAMLHVSTAYPVLSWLGIKYTMDKIYMLHHLDVALATGQDLYL